MPNIEYERVNWENGTRTPLGANNLNKGDEIPMSDTYITEKIIVQKVLILEMQNKLYRMEMGMKLIIQILILI